MYLDKRLPKVCNYNILILYSFLAEWYVKNVSSLLLELFLKINCLIIIGHRNVTVSCLFFIVLYGAKSETLRNICQRYLQINT